MATAAPSELTPRSFPRRFLAAVSITFGVNLLSLLFWLLLTSLGWGVNSLLTRDSAGAAAARKLLSFGLSFGLPGVAGIGLMAAGFALVGRAPWARRSTAAFSTEMTARQPVTKGVVSGLYSARRLDRRDIPERLARNVRIEHLAWDRVQNLLALVGHYREHPATREALGAAIDDESPEVRLQAAIALGEEGCEALLEVCGAGDDSCASRAIFALGERLPQERAREILWNALRRRRMQTARACLDALGRLGTEAVEALAKVLLVEKGELAVAAARALGATGLTAAERPLLDALERDLPELRVSAAIALGRVGTAEAVMPLKAAEVRHPDDDYLGRASRQAVAAIQSRTGAEPGRLSVAEDGSGQLSLPEDERGRLSLTPSCTA